MNRVFKIGFTLAVGIIMTMAFSASVFAASFDNGTNVTTTDTQITMAKKINVVNPDVTSIKGPGITYDFNVAPATVASGTQVTDGTTTATVHAGPQDGLGVTTNPSFPASSAVTASSAGTDNSSNLVMDVDLSKFSSAGIYRYVLTDDTTAASLTAAGITRSASYDATRYIDVYINNVGNGLGVSGYVIGSDADGDGNLTKETFEDSTPSAGGTAVDTTDVFTTHNVILSNTVQGNMGDKQNQFAFAGVIAGNNSRQLEVEKVAKNGSPTYSGSFTSAPQTTLADGESFYVYGLSPAATIDWTETNNTTDTYQVSVNEGTATSVAASGTKSSGALGTNVSFVNELSAVSPTGVVLRYGAPIMILLAAFAAFVAFRRARKDEANLA